MLSVIAIRREGWKGRIVCHFPGFERLLNIASPFVDFSNISFAMRLSLSSNGNSNQARASAHQVEIAFAVSSPLAKAIRK